MKWWWLLIVICFSVSLFGTGWKKAWNGEKRKKEEGKKKGKYFRKSLSLIFKYFLLFFLSLWNPKVCDMKSAGWICLKRLEFVMCFGVSGIGSWEQMVKFPGITLVAWNLRWWEFLHHGNRKSYKSAPSPSWLFSCTPLPWPCLLQVSRGITWGTTHTN